MELERCFRGSAPGPRWGFSVPHIPCIRTPLVTASGSAQGAMAQRPQNSGTFYMRAHSMRNNQIWHGDQITRGEIFTLSTANADARSVCAS